MRPRRPFRPRIPRPAPRFGPPLPNRQVPPLLLKANQLFERGEYANAANLYQELGDKAAARKLPPAAHLYVRGGRAYMLDGNIEAATALFKKGFELFANLQRWHELKWVSERVIGDLLQQGKEDAASELTNWLTDNVKEDLVGLSERSAMASGNKRSKPQLPLKCPSCGASVHPDEVEWVDENIAECNYCGNMMRGE